MHKLELRRQFAHAIYGPILILLYEWNIIDLNLILGLIIGGAFMSIMIKRKRFHPVRRVLSLFERHHHMENFPGRGILFFTIGAYLTLLLFPKQFAYPGILILSFGDAISNIVGRHFGKVLSWLHPDKFIEGSVAGILVSIPIAYYFVPNITAAIAASTVAMFLELPNVRIGNLEIDDNLLIPLGAAFTLSLFV